MSVDQIGVNLPSDPAVRLKLKNGIDELVSSLVRVQSEKDLQKDIVKTLKDASGLTPRTINRWAKWKFKDNKDREVGVITDEEAAYDILYNISDEDEDDEV